MRESLGMVTRRLAGRMAPANGVIMSPLGSVYTATVSMATTVTTASRFYPGSDRIRFLCVRRPQRRLRLESGRIVIGRRDEHQTGGGDESGRPVCRRCSAFLREAGR